MLGNGEELRHDEVVVKLGEGHDVGYGALLIARLPCQWSPWPPLRAPSSHANMDLDLLWNGIKAPGFGAWSLECGPG